jgi:hypothetical protein
LNYLSSVPAETAYTPVIQRIPRYKPVCLTVINDTNGVLVLSLIIIDNQAFSPLLWKIDDYLKKRTMDESGLFDL